MANRLEGHWREAWRLKRRPSRERDACYPRKIAVGATQIEAHLRTCERTIEVAVPPLPTPTPRPQKARRTAPPVDLPTQRDRLSGVDSTRLDGIAGRTAPPRLAEIGLDMRRWKRETPCTSWLGFCPDHRISGGSVRTRATRDVVTRAADGWRLAAHKLLHRNRALGANDRRLRARLGAPTDLTALAHTRARLVYRRRKVGQPDVAKGLEQDDARFRQQRLQWLQRQPRALHLPLVHNQLVPAPGS
jgi:hypothetical protein